MKTPHNNGKSNGNCRDLPRLSSDTEDQFVFQAAAVDPDWEDQARNHATEISHGRSVKRLYVLRAEEKVVEGELAHLEPRHRAAEDVLKETPEDLPNQKRRYKLPRGWAGVMVIIRAVGLVALGLSEWWNAAGFPARGEMQSYVAAGACTFVFAATFLCLSAKPEKEEEHRRLMWVGWSIFVIVFTACFVAEQSIAEAARAAIGSGSANLWRWLLLPSQIFASTMTASVLIICIVKSLVVIDDAPISNPHYPIVLARRNALWEQIASRRMRLGEVQGEIQEIQSGEQAYVRRCVQFAKVSRARAQYLDQITPAQPSQHCHQS